MWKLTSRWVLRGVPIVLSLVVAGIALAVHQNDVGAIFLAAAFMLGVVFLLFGNPRPK